MADTRQDIAFWIMFTLWTAVLAAAIVLANFATKQQATIRSLRQQLSQPCEGRK